MSQPAEPAISGHDFVHDWYKNAALLAGTYAASQEHDPCSVGLVAALDGRARREVVQAGIDALKAVWHRGAVDAAGKTGDGAGIRVKIPQDFFADAVRRGGGRRRSRSPPASASPIRAVGELTALLQAERHGFA